MVAKKTDSLLIKINQGKMPVDFNWNREEHPKSSLPKNIPAEPSVEQIRNIKIVAEDLRDGLHGVSHYPEVEEMVEYVNLLSQIGIREVTVGIYPGEVSIIDYRIKQLLKVMREKYVQMIPTVLCMATEASLKWTADCKAINPSLKALVFMGTSPSRMLVEEWEEDFVLEKLAWAIKEAREKYNIEVIGATEHTTQTPPDFLEKIIKVCVQNGAKTFCIADTIGISRPVGTFRIVKFVRETLHKLKADDVLIDWHGHRDMGNDQANAMAAICAGANRIHTVARGIGERAGNTQMESIMLNCARILEENSKKPNWNMKKLNDVLSKYDEIVKIPRPSHGPLGQRSHKTSLGIHTSAMLKAKSLTNRAKKLKYDSLASKLNLMSQMIYTAVDPEKIGLNHEISVGPWSGTSTVKLASILQGQDLKNLTDETIEHILLTAKKLGRELSSSELEKLL